MQQPTSGNDFPPPTYTEKPGLNQNPQLLTQPQLGAQPQLVAQLQLGAQPQFGTQPQLGAQPQLGLQPQLGAQPQLFYQPQLVTAPPVAQGQVFLQHQGFPGQVIIQQQPAAQQFVTVQRNGFKAGLFDCFSHASLLDIILSCCDLCRPIIFGKIASKVYSYPKRGILLLVVVILTILMPVFSRLTKVGITVNNINNYRYSDNIYYRPYGPEYAVSRYTEVFWIMIALSISAALALSCLFFKLRRDVREKTQTSSKNACGDLLIACFCNCCNLLQLVHEVKDLPVIEV